MTAPNQEYRVIPLTNAPSAKVSVRWYAELSQKNWRGEWNDTARSWYAYRSCKVNGKTVRIYMHRYILGLVHLDGKIGDHINHDTLDNTDENLRVVTNHQSMWNIRRKVTNKSGFKGVHLCKQTGRWSAHITFNRKNYNLGRFATPELAHAAYCAAAERFFGEFRCVA